MTGLVIKVQDINTKEIKDFTILGGIPLESARMRLQREFNNAPEKLRKGCSFSLGSAKYDFSTYRVDWDTFHFMSVIFG
jgi:hypothetical protein